MANDTEAGHDGTAQHNEQQIDSGEASFGHPRQFLPESNKSQHYACSKRQRPQPCDYQQGYSGKGGDVISRVTD